MLFLYIHGFNSSPASFKARAFEQFLAKQHPEHEYCCPELSDYPSEAIAQLTEILHTDPSETALIGSSLGGFYATYLAQKYHLKAVLINPAVNPHILLKDLLGKNTNYYTGKEYQLTQDHIDQLKSFKVEKIIDPELFMVLLQSGDEVLDYQLAEHKYSSTQLIIEQGGNHSFEGFVNYCESIYQFCVALDNQ